MRGFAKFAGVPHAARIVRDRATGAPVEVKACKKANVTPVKDVRTRPLR